MCDLPGLVSVTNVSLLISIYKHLGSCLSNQNIRPPQHASKTGLPVAVRQLPCMSCGIVSLGLISNTLYSTPILPRREL